MGVRLVGLACGAGATEMVGWCACCWQSNCIAPSRSCRGIPIIAVEPPGAAEHIEIATK